MTVDGIQRFAAMLALGCDVGTPVSLTGAASPGAVAVNPGWARPPVVSDETLRQQAAAVLQCCYHWLEAAVPIVPETAELVPILVAAVQQYQAQQYEACLAQAAAVVQTARQLRQAVPALPPL